MMGSEKMIPNRATLVHVVEPDFACTDQSTSGEEEIQYDNEGKAVLPPEYVSETTALLALRTAGDTCPDPALYAKSELREIMSLLLPAKQWIDCNRLWEQQVSTEPALRPEVKQINENLTKRLADREAKETGVCMVRRELYNQVFDEIIREITVLCPERGLLLLRIRNELRMSMDAFRSIYESSKLVVTQREESIDSVDPEAASQEAAELEFKISEIELEKTRLKNHIQALTDNMALKEIKHNELIEAEAKKHTEEVEFQEKVQKQLQRQLDLFTGPSPHIQKTGTLLNALFAKKDQEAAAAAAAAKANAAANPK